MFRPRIIPCLLLKNQGLVKTVQFKDPKYLGDPINIVRIFNDKEVDELVFLDITATNDTKEPPFELLRDIASEAFVPFAYGGGIHRLDQVKSIIDLGVEKIIINTYAVKNINFIKESADVVGSQSVVVSIDIKKNIWGKYEVYTHGGTRRTGIDPISHAIEVEKHGAGELLINSIDRDGTMKGYDIQLMHAIAEKVDIPTVACGGAANINDLASVIRQGRVSAAAAGSMFVFHGPHKAVLITYPSQDELTSIFNPNSSTS